MPCRPVARSVALGARGQESARRKGSIVKTPKRLLRQRAIAAVGAGTLAMPAGALLAPSPSYASSHREAPLISAGPRADNTDTYAFVSPDKPDTVTIVANWYPCEEPNGGPNFYPFATDARHNIKIENNGDGKADVTYRWVFTDHYRDASGQFLYNTGVVDHINSPNLNFFQTYTLTEIDNGEKTTLLTNKLVAPS